ncbi:MAG: tRNA (guanosine(46)-N7)-methyltransferase TrmB [Zoogloeaceae bacterium]|jgi:tRNA (guanine-N7-)-methyltransferase|nr:tRNA (guanosine(46)-N7)-methyltransferase TrmB [Zoogloeaceae bacterium]
MPEDREQTGEAETSFPRGHIRSFVRRGGRFSAAQERHFQAMMPKIGVPYRAGTLDFSRLFGRDAPRILEIGCGMGETTARIALENPDKDYLGVEVHTPGVGSLCKLVAEHGLTNVRIAQHDAVEVMRDMIPEASLAGIHIFFPDPWQKKRHHKRRLIQPPFVALLASRLMAGGYLRCATDWEDYAEHMLATLAAEPLLLNGGDGIGASGYALRPATRPLTKFESRGIRLGHGVWDLFFIRKTES